MNSHTPFRRWLRRTLSPKEEAYVLILERQRRSRGFVRAFVNDPEGELTAVACEYVAWFQTFVNSRDALVFTPLKSPKLPIPRVFQASARSFRKHQGRPLCIGQALLFGADAYCPSVPMYRNYFTQMFSLARGYLNLRDTILLVHGNTARRRGRITAFARLYRQLLDTRGDFYALIDAAAMAAHSQEPVTVAVGPNILNVPLRIPARVRLHFQPAHAPYLPRAAPVAA